MDKHENNCKYNIAETCCASISIDQLRALSEDKDRQPFQTADPLTYGAIRGSDALRDNLARLYSVRTGNPLPRGNIITTNGAIQANYLVAYALLGPGDHVICHYPTCRYLPCLSKGMQSPDNIKTSHFMKYQDNSEPKSPSGKQNQRTIGFRQSTS